ncbi:MAG TPA: thiol peroxidase, partial [Phycisphaerae bacterium]|nr:thiol peroxidase [Phycisphaerae bacterium]
EYEGRATFLKVDTDAAGELARSYGVSSIPTVVLFHKGLEERRWVGVQGSDTYRAAIEAIIQRELKPQNGMRKESAMPQREGVVTMKGSPVTLVGGEVKVGDPAPDFTAVANDLRDVKLSDYRGKTVILASVPSLDTGVCATETRRFNQEAAGLGDDVVILTISMDLPFAQKRWCGAEGVDRVVTLSDHREASFGSAYGVLIEGLRLLARAIFVVSPDGKIAYTQLVKEIATEPDYGPALAAVRELTGG